MKLKFTKDTIPTSEVNIAAKLCTATYKHATEPEQTLNSLMSSYGFKKEDYLWFDITSTDTQAIITVINGDIYLAFQGTQTIQDWITNGQFDLKGRGAGNWHMGFANIATKTFDKITSALLQLHDIYPDAQIILTGHSLGGALAQVYSELISEKLSQLKIKYLITFAQPRVGNRSFVEEFEGRGIPFFRFFNEDDIVPDLPPSSKWAEWYHPSGIILKEASWDMDTALYDKSHWARIIPLIIELFKIYFIQKKPLAELAAKVTDLHSMDEYERRIINHSSQSK